MSNKYGLGGQRANIGSGLAGGTGPIHEAKKVLPTRKAGSGIEAAKAKSDAEKAKEKAEVVTQFTTVRRAGSGIPSKKSK